MTRQVDKAQQAMESYLDDLFDEVEDSVAPTVEPTINDVRTNKSSTKSTPAKTSKKSKSESPAEPENTSENPSYKPYNLGSDNVKPTFEQRHQIERVERLLEDYNTRHAAQLETKEELKEDKKVALLRPVLEPVPEPTEAAVEDEPEQVVEADVELPEETTELKSYSERPEWSKGPFQALMFNVAGMDLAVPLITLGGIQRLDKEVTQLFGKPDWFMGLTPGLEGNINVVDTCRWVMPEKYGEAKTKGLNYSFIIMLGESSWGLACSHAQNALTIDPDNVKWRTGDSRRPWLSGMLIDERCVLLDVDVLIDLLDSNYQR